ncbi:MAG: hypothetical protein ACLUSW_04780 [Faecalibacterium sp.]
MPNWPGRTRLRHRWMWTPACPGWKILRSRRTFFSGWVQDYRTLAQVQHQKHFFFIPQGSINTPQEFTAALQAYAEEHGMQLSLTKEGMYPEFSLDGISYKAYRNPGKYRDEICCDAVHPGAAEHRAAVPAGTAAAHRCVSLLPAGMHLCRHPGGRVDSRPAVTGWLWLAALAAAGVLLGRCFEHRL